MTIGNPPDFDHNGQYEPGVPPGYGVVPGSGYDVPGTRPGWYPQGDPLVTAPHEGFGGWFNRLTATLHQSWKSLALISLMTFVVPLVALSAISTYTDSLRVDQLSGSRNITAADGGTLALLLLFLVVAAIAASYLNGVAQAAAVFTITRTAAGTPPRVGDAMSYGFRHGHRLWGWGILWALMITAGICACILPGLYLALAGCLFIPVALYQRGQNPIGVSFSLINKNFGPALGRMALVAAVTIGVSLVLELINIFVTAASTAAGVVFAVISQLVSAGFTMVFIVATVLLFAELWGKQVTLTTHDLNYSLR